MGLGFRVKGFRAQRFRGFGVKGLAIRHGMSIRGCSMLRIEERS